MVARLDNEPSHEVVERALEALDNLEHRGAEGADVRTGDGAGILVQLPDAFFRGVVDFELPEPGRYGVGVCFLPRDAAHRDKLEQLSSATSASRASACSAGATCRSTRRTSATPPTRRARTSARCSSAPARATTTTRTRSSASST